MITAADPIPDELRQALEAVSQVGRAHLLRVPVQIACPTEPFAGASGDQVLDLRVKSPLLRSNCHNRTKDRNALSSVNADQVALCHLY